MHVLTYLAEHTFSMQNAMIKFWTRLMVRVDCEGSVAIRRFLSDMSVLLYALYGPHASVIVSMNCIIKSHRDRSGPSRYIQALTLGKLCDTASPVSFR